MGSERFPKMNVIAREEGWGRVTDEVLGILPENVEAQARMVARWAAIEIGEKDAELTRLRAALAASQASQQAAVAAVLREAGAVLDQHDGAPCAPASGWSANDADFYTSGQMDAAASWKAAIRALGDTP